MKSESAGVPKVYVVIVNWRRADLTLRCLESVFASEYPRFGVIVCDNGSGDGSRARFERWGSAQRLDSGALEVLGLGQNRGFAAGCNAGMRAAIERGDCDYVWLLNNDATVDRRALAELVDELGRRPGAGFCGSTVLIAGRTGRVQALGGGSYDPWFGRTRLFARKSLPTGARLEREADRVRRRMDFVLGASMLVDRRVIEEIGLMSEDYFLYLEELDWTRRCRGAFTLTFAPASRVYHDVGATIGSSMEGRSRSTLSDYYGIRNRILFTRRHHRWCMPTVYLGLFLTAWVRLFRGQLGRIGMIAELALWGLGLRDEERVRRRYVGPSEDAVERAG